MKVSVLIPTHKRRAMLEDCLASARRQTYADLEILVSDDGPEGETSSFVRAQSELDPRVRLLPKNPTPGLFQNFNHLLSHARGDAFIFVCDDDRLVDGCVERLVAALEAHPEAVAATAEFWFCDVEGRRLEDVSHRHLSDAGRVGLPEGIWPGVLRQAMIAKVNVGCALFRASIFGAERFDIRSMTAADVDFWIRAAQKGPVYYIPERLSELRVHPETASAGRVEPIAEGIIYTMQKHANAAPELEPDRLRVLQIFRASYAWRMASQDERVSRRVGLDYLRDMRQSVAAGEVASVMAALALTLFPRPLARELQEVAQGFKER